MTVSEDHLEERARYVVEAKESGFLDAVFLIHYYNHDRKRWGPPPKPEDIRPQEVFETFDIRAYEDALKRSRKLLAENSSVGMAFFEYPPAKVSYEEAVRKFRANNPGFCDKTYETAINAGIRDMR